MQPKHLTRRRFLATALAATSSLGLPLLAVDKPARKIKYIDFHSHLGAFYLGQELTAELLVRFMDQHNLENACVLPLIGHAASF